MALNEIINLSETPLSVLPNSFINSMQNLLNTMFFLIGGFIGIFVISFFLRWYQVKKMQNRLNEIDSHLEYLTEKVEEALTFVKKK